MRKERARAQTSKGKKGQLKAVTPSVSHQDDSLATRSNHFQLLVPDTSSATSDSFESTALDSNRPSIRQETAGRPHDLSSIPHIRPLRPFQYGDSYAALSSI